MNMDYSLLLLLLTSAVQASETLRCEQGQYFDQRYDACRLCSSICFVGWGTPEKCQRYASECKPTTLHNSSAVSSRSDLLSSTTTEGKDHEQQQQQQQQQQRMMTSSPSDLLSSTDTKAQDHEQRLMTNSHSNLLSVTDIDVHGHENQQQRMMTIVVVVAISFLVVLIVLSAITVTVSRRRRLKVKTSLVHAVHPVEEGKAQIIPSSWAPPRIIASSSSSNKNNLMMMTSSSFLFPVDFRGPTTPASSGRETTRSGVECENFANETPTNRYNAVVYKSTFDAQRF